MARIELDEIMTGLGMLGGVLSLPRQVQNQQIANEQMKTLLAGSGLPDEMIKAATPEPSMRWLSAGQPGFGGKVLGGVGDVGSILTTVVGKPIKAPRMELADLAAASKLRSSHAEQLAKQRLSQVIMDPKSTKRDIAAASIAAGNTQEAIRLMRGDGEGRPPASILGLRSAIESMSDDDPRKPAYKRALADQLEYERQQREEADRLIRERQPPHYTPEETEARRHAQIMKDRDTDARARGYKPGTPEYDYYMSYGHPRVERQAAPERTYEEDFDAEVRRRTSLLGKAGQPKRLEDFPEPVDVTVRRNRAAREKGKAAEKSGAPIPEKPPPPAPKPGTEAYRRQQLEEGVAAGLRGTAGLEGGGSTTTTTPGTTTTTTTQPPAADTSDAAAWAIFDAIDPSTLPPGAAEMLLAARKAGTPAWTMANWARSLQQARPQP
jgi:hypothetical protein